MFLNKAKLFYLTLLVVTNISLMHGEITSFGQDDNGKNIVDTRTKHRVNFEEILYSFIKNLQQRYYLKKIKSQFEEKNKRFTYLFFK